MENKQLAMMRSIIGISHYRPSSIESVFFEDETDIVIGVLHVIMSFLVIIVSLITFMILIIIEKMLIFIERIGNQIVDIILDWYQLSVDMVHNYWFIRIAIKSLISTSLHVTDNQPN